MPKIQAPKGTRDFYPDDLLRRRYVERLWRDTSIRHGFEEIDGPAFESADLYKVKSGEGILGEMFGVFSGKAAEDLEQVRQTGEAPFALRPEFTPTLARMYAARAGALPKPTKWFWMQNCFRAERPQRGRLREFGQWNCDIMGGAGGDLAALDAELIGVAAGLIDACGLSTRDVRVRLNDRRIMAAFLNDAGVPAEKHAAAFALLDRRAKVDDPRSLAADAPGAGLGQPGFIAFLTRPRVSEGSHGGPRGEQFDALTAALRDAGAAEWCDVDPDIARGLAYYTGMVFEVIALGERAVAGGGRYDNLIELFGGPPTPAVGFGMGDVVLSLLLEDKGLMPDATRAMEFLSRPSASYRPEAFVIAANDEAAARVRPLVAELRRGREAEAWKARGDRKPWDSDRHGGFGQPPLAPPEGGVRPMHARHSYKATKNIGKLLQDAAGQRARFAVILESEHEATLKTLDTGVQDTARTPIERVPAELASRLSTP